MRAAVLLVLLSVPLPLFAAPSPLPRRERAEKPSLVGEWKLIRPHPGNAWHTYPGGLSVKGDELILSLDLGLSEDVKQHARLTTSRDAAPGAIELQFYLVRYPGRDDKVNGPPVQCIFRIDRDVLTLVLGTAQQRPTGFDRSPDNNQVFVFRRVR
jgi:uncharacterized protein (TIGR03067 family)